MRLEDGTLHVGAMTTFAELQADPLVRRHARCLAEAAAQVGSAQIRNVATVGGNIANASPCADTVTALVALDADVHTIDGGGRERRAAAHARSLDRLGPHQPRARTRPSPRSASRRSARDQRTTFAKIGSRSTVTVARLSMALVVKYDADAGIVSERQGRARGGRRGRLPRRSPGRASGGPTGERGVGPSVRRRLHGRRAPRRSPAGTRCPTSSTPWSGWPTTPGTPWDSAIAASPPGAERRRGRARRRARLDILARIAPAWRQNVLSSS